MELKFSGRKSSGGVAPVEGKSISQRANFRESPLLMAGFFSVFLLTGLGFLMFFALPAMKVIDARTWTAVDCEILSSSVEGHSSSDGSTYSIEVSYRYSVDGAEYVGDRYEFLGGSSSGYDGKKKVVDRIPPGSVATCYVDPDDPQQSVFNRSFSWFYLIALMPLIFIAVGGIGMAYSLTAGRKKAKAASARALHGQEGGFREIESLAMPVTTPGPVELEETMSPMGKLGCLMVITFFWNGILSLFGWQLWASWRSGGGFDGCLVIFLIPFVLVGLGLVVAIPYQILALANPRPRLTMGHGSVPLGGSTQLDWKFEGQARRLQDLKIWLEGTEEATYRRGTDTHTDKSVFATIEVAHRGSGMPLGRGNATIEIPSDTMHSFKADRNAIVWKLKLHGSIARWPDVVTEFPFVVSPGEGEEW